MPGLQSIVKAWTKINYDHVDYVDENKNKRSGESSSSIAFADQQLPRRPSASSSSSTGGGGDARRRKLGRRGQAWISDQGSNYADSSSDNASVSVSASANSIGGIAKLFHEANISGESPALANEEVGDGRGSVIVDQPTSTQKFTPSLLINSTQDDVSTLHQNSQQQQQQQQQQYQHQETAFFSAQQRHLQKSPPPTLPTPSSYLATNLSSHTFSLTGGNDGMFDNSDVSMKLHMNDDLNRHQLSRRSNIYNQHHYNSRNADDRGKSAGDVMLGRRRPSNSTARATATVDAMLNQLHQQENQLYRTIKSGSGINIGDNISNSMTPLTTNKAHFPQPTHHSGVTYSSTRKQTIPKPLHFPFDKDRHTGISQFTPGSEPRRRGISRQQQQIKEDLERHQTPDEILSRMQAQNSKDKGRQRNRQSSNLLELFLLEEEQQQLDTSASKLIVPANEGDEEEDLHDEGEPSNMRSYHRRRYIMGGPLRGQEQLSMRSRDAHTRSKPQTEDQWMQEWLTHTNRNATTSSLVRGTNDQPQKRNSQSSSSSGTTVTANRSLSIRGVHETSNVTMKMPLQSTAATDTNETSDVDEHPTPNRESNTSDPSQDGRISTASTHHCNRCAQMESALLALHADLEYLRSLELQREFVDTGTRDGDNDQAASASLPPINKKKALNNDVNNVMSTTPSSSQSISSAVTMGSRGSLSSSRFGSIARSRQQQQRQLLQQQQQQQQPQQYQKRNSSSSQVNAYMTLRDASKRLTDLSTRHQRQVKQSMHDCAYWQNDMHLKLEKFALMCKNLNEEAACRGNEVKETRALLDKMTSERNALASEAEVLRAQVDVYEKECAEQSSLREEWEQERINMLSDKELEIKVRDEIIDDMSKRLELAVEAIESERKLQIMRRSIIFPQSRPPQPSSPSTLQHKQTDADSVVTGKQTTPLDSVSKVYDFYSEELKKSKEISAKAQKALQACMVESATREKELQFRLGTLERELVTARRKKSTNQEMDMVKDSLEYYDWYRPPSRRRRSL